MSHIMNRRKALATGATSTAMLTGISCSDTEQVADRSSGTDSLDFLTPWSPPPNLERDLTPGSTSIRLCSWSGKTTLDYPRDISITELVKRIRDAGFTAGNATGPREGRNPWNTASEAELRELKDALETYDVFFFDMHTYANNIHPDLEQRSKNHRYVIEQCEAAERVGCPMITTHLGTRSGEIPITIHRDNFTMETWKLAVNTIRQLLSDTAGMKVAFGIEAVNLTCMNNPWAHRQLIDEVGDPRLKIVLDPVNMINLGTYFRTTELINECFDLLGEHIIAGHAKDTLVTPDLMSAYLTEVAAGEGTMDYETYLVRWSRLNWPRPLLIEHLPEEKYPQAQKYIVETAAQVGVKFYG